MLETELVALREEVVNLRQVVVMLTTTLSTQIPAAPEPEATGPKAKKAAAEPTPSPEPTPAATVTTDDLSALTKQIVKKHPDRRDAIKETIRAHGAPVLIDIDPARLPELKAALEALL